MTIDTPLVPSTFNPYVQVGAAQDEVYQVEEQLFEPMPVPGNPSQVKTEPALASSWSVSPNGLVYTFHIREGVRFSNGEPLTGEDVVFSLKKVESPTDTEVTVVKPWTKISLVAPMTVQLQLSKPQSVLPELLAVYQASIVPKRLYEHKGERRLDCIRLALVRSFLRARLPALRPLRRCAIQTIGAVVGSHM